MNIAFIHQWGRGGAVVWSSKIISYLQDSGCEVTVFTKEFDSEPEHPTNGGRHVEIETPDLHDIAKLAPRGINSMIEDIGEFMFYGNTLNELDGSDYDCIIVTENLFFGNLAKRTNVPTVMKLSGEPWSFYYDIMNPFKTSYDSLDMFDGIIATGPVPDNIGGQVSTQIVTINPGVDQELFRPVKKRDQEDVNILYVGRFGPVKRVNNLVSAFSEVQAEHENAKLTLVGDGPLRGKIEKQTDELGISDHVEMHGYVPQHELPKYYNHADVLVLPSQIERAPLVLLEAMSCGITVVSTPVGWVPEIITDGKNGVLFEIGNEAELADEIRYLIDNPEHRNKMGEKARRTVKEGYTWEDRGDKVLDLLNSMINE